MSAMPVDSRTRWHCAFVYICIFGTCAREPGGAESWGLELLLANTRRNTAFAVQPSPQSPQVCRDIGKYAIVDDN
eukprot:11173170-Lingulodinium_polyedra.AAC.1